MQVHLRYFTSLGNGGGEGTMSMAMAGAMIAPSSSTTTALFRDESACSTSFPVLLRSSVLSQTFAPSACHLSSPSQYRRRLGMATAVPDRVEFHHLVAWALSPWRNRASFERKALLGLH